MIDLTKDLPDIKDLLKYIEQNTIERCAQVADSYELGDPSIKGIEAICCLKIAAAIRALKDKP